MHASRMLAIGLGLLLAGCASNDQAQPTALTRKDAPPQYSVRQAEALPADYIARFDGRHAYEVSPGMELALILIALATADAEGPEPIIRSTPYYEEVIAHFGPHRDHPVFAAIAISRDNSAGITALRNNAYNWRLENGEWRRDDFLGNWWSGEEYPDAFSPNLELIADFARQSDFESFFNAHQAFYAEHISRYTEVLDLNQMAAWLDGHFDIPPITSVRLMFSPLQNGNQSTTIKRSGAFQQVFIIAGPARVSDNRADALRSGMWIFTELDHQYVNPTSDMHADAIERAFADRTVWTGGRESNNYSRADSVFNEYMTWATYVLYVHDTYPADVAAAHERVVVEFIETRRGFPRFGAFLAELDRLGGDHPRLAARYPALLAWAETQTA